MTVHEKVTEIVRFIIEDELFSDHYFCGSENSGNFYMLMKQVFPQAEPLLRQKDFFEDGKIVTNLDDCILTKIGFRHYALRCSVKSRTKPSPADEATVEKYRESRMSDEQFNEAVAKVKAFYNTLPETKLTDEEEAKIKKLSKICDKTLDDVKPLMTQACNFKGNSCEFMRKKAERSNCCDEYECNHATDEGCKLGKQKPLFCKSYLCKTARLGFIERLKKDSDMVDRYRDVVGVFAKSENYDLLQKEWEYTLNT